LVDINEFDNLLEKCVERIQGIQGRSTPGFMPTSEDTLMISGYTFLASKGAFCVFWKNSLNCIQGIPGRSTPGFMPTSEDTLALHCISKGTWRFDLAEMREIDIFSEKCVERVQCIQGRSAPGFMPTSEDTSGIHIVGCEGKKGCMGVGDGTWF
jgi:hypothetical protein